METITPWLTPALVLGLFVWLRLEVTGRIDRLRNDLNTRFDRVDNRFDRVDDRFEEVNKRFDGVTREIADLRERMAKLEGTLEGFVAGRRDRDAA